MKEDRSQWNPTTLNRISRREWVSLVVVAILLGVFLSQVGIKQRANCRHRVGAVDLEQSIESKMGFKGI